MKMYTIIQAQAHNDEPNSVYAYLDLQDRLNIVINKHHFM